MFGIYCQKNKSCDLLQSVTIAGAICESITSNAASIRPKKDDTMPWELSGAGLCHAVVAKHSIEADGRSCKLVIDATYGRDDALLLEINHTGAFLMHRGLPSC